MKDWFFLFRPWSFTATLVPFLIAAGLALHRAGCQWSHWGLGLLSGILFQATTNLLNTWGDEKSGVDDVPGAIRTTPQIHDGRISLRALGFAAVTCALLASALGLGLCLYRTDGVWRVNTPLLVAGFLGFLGATNYTTGIRFKYHGLGVPFVSFLMGPLEIFVALSLLLPDAAMSFLGQAVTGAPVLQTGLLAALPIAALVGVILHGNDMRDMPTDRSAGITTLALRLGVCGSLAYYVLCHTLPYLLSVLTLLLRSCRTGTVNPWLLLPLLALPISIRTATEAIRTYRAAPDCPPWRGLERTSGKVLLVYGLLLALALSLR